LIAVKGNPLEDISILQTPDKHLSFICKDGVIFREAI